MSVSLEGLRTGCDVSHPGAGTGAGAGGSGVYHEVSLRSYMDKCRRIVLRVNRAACALGLGVVTLECIGRMQTKEKKRALSLAIPG